MLSPRALLVLLVSIATLASAVAAAATPVTTPYVAVVPESNYKKTLRQTTRLEILQRRENKALKEKRRQEKLALKRLGPLGTRTQLLAPRASETPFPTCDTTGQNAIPYTGFVSVPGWYINRDSPYDVVSRVTLRTQR